MAEEDLVIRIPVEVEVSEIDFEDGAVRFSFDENQVAQEIGAWIDQAVKSAIEQVFNAHGIEDTNES